MENKHNFMTFNIFLLLRRILFIYQQEVYNSNKLLQFFYSQRVFTNPEKRQTIHWTLKTRPCYGISITLFLSLYLSLVLQFWWQNTFILFTIKSIILYFLLLFFLPFFLISANVCLFPLETHLKNKKIKKAKEQLRKHKDHLTIIAITGSFGKTSVKELLCYVLSKKYSVIATPENKNTPLGFCEFANQISLTHEFLIIEMGAYTKGDIKEMCNIIEPDFGVLTGINEQHLERFKNIENIIQTKNELTSSIPQNGIIWVNEENDLAKKSAPQYAKCSLRYYNKKNIQSVSYTPQGQKIIMQNNVLLIGNNSKDDTKKSQKLLSIQSHFLADYFPLLCDLAFQVGKHFQVPSQSIIQALESIQAPQHRLSHQYYKETDILIIDDSYNGNFDGAISAIKTLSHFKEKHTIYLTPGLVELGKESASIHEEIGKFLGKNCKEAWLIKNSTTESLIRGLKKSDFPLSSIRIFNTSTEAHQAVKTDILSGSVLLIQNDWTDNYL